MAEDLKARRNAKRQSNGGTFIEEKTKSGIAAPFLLSVLIFSLGTFSFANGLSPAQTLPPRPQQGIISVTSSPELFSTLSALYAAGYGANTSWRGEDPEIASYIDQLRQLHGPATEALRQYYHDHLLEDPAETMSRFVSFGLVIGPPPHFPYEFAREELPPDVLSIDDFNEPLGEFYEEAQIGQQWARLQPKYEKQVRLLEGPVSKIVLGVNGYLREVVNSSTGRQFIVVEEPLIGSRTNFRIYGTHYTVIVASGDDPPIDDIRHAYLHFVLDPLAFKYGRVVDTRRALHDVAARAPRLPAQYVEDFPAFLTECLIKAVELRQQKLPLAKLDAAFDENDANGFILVRPLYDGLQKFEQSEPAMSYYYPDLIETINVAAEKKRLQDFKFPPVDTSAAQPEKPLEISELQQLLDAGDNAIARQNVPLAISTFEHVLGKYPGDLHAMYGLAVATAMKGDARQAQQLFEQVIAAGTKASVNGGVSPDPSVMAWSHVYLGRIADVIGDRISAVNEYRSAISVAGVPDAAKAAAQKGIDSAYRSQAPAGNPAQQPQQ